MKFLYLRCLMQFFRKSAGKNKLAVSLLFSALFLVGGNFLKVKAQTTFQIAYGGSLGDQALEVEKTSDGYVLGGFTNSFGAGGADFYLIKTDNNGNVQWSKTYGGSGNDYCFGLLKAANGGYIMGGYTTGFGASANDVFILQTDSLGVLLWTRKIGGFSDDFTITLTGDSGCVLVGTTKSFGSGAADFFLCKLDKDGNLIWSKAVGGTSHEWGGQICQTSDGGYIATGQAFGFGSGNNYDFYIVKIDANGNLQWTKTYGGPKPDEGRHIEQTADGGFIIVGHTQSFGAGVSDILLIKTDASGNIQWNKTYGGSGNDYGESVKQTSDGGYIINGYTTSFGFGNSDVYIIKTDDSGNIQWTRTYGAASEDYSRDLITTPDGGYAIASYTQSFGAGGLDCYLIKTDNNGNTGCNEKLTTATVTNIPAVAVSSGGVVLTASPTVTTPTPVVTSPITVKTVLCQTQPAPGSSCSNPISLTTANTCTPADFIMSGTEMWFSFVAGTQKEIITLYGNTLATIIVYEGNCSALNVFISSSLPLDSTSFSISKTTFVIGNLYYVKVTGNSSQNFGICVSNKLLTVCVPSACQQIGNFDFANTTIGDPIDPFTNGDVQCWDKAFQSPQISTTTSHSVPNHAVLWARVLGSSSQAEGILSAVNVVAGQSYVLSYWQRKENNSSSVIDNIFVILANSTTSGLPLTGNVNIPNPPNPSLQIDGPLNGNINFTSITWVQRQVCFVANDNYDQLYIYPHQNSPISWTGWLGIDDVTLTQIIVDAGSDQALQCTQSANVPMPVCTSAVAIYSWLPTIGVSNPNIPNPILSPTSSTTYTLTVTALGCVVQDMVTINVNNTLTLSINSTNLSCNGGSDGSSTVIATGGTPSYTFLWSTGATTANISNLTTATYSVTVTDANSCISTASVTITQPATPLTITATGTNVSCNSGSNGSAIVTVSGGTPSYTFLWSNGATTANISNLTAATYTVTITDANNCTATASVTITQPTTALSATVSGTDESCAGANDGTANVTAQDGTQPYSYLWSTSSIAANISNLTAATYTVTVTDANNCSTNASIVIGVSSTVPVAAFTSFQTTACSGDVSFINNSTPAGLTYQWDFGDGNTSTALNPTHTYIGSGTFNVTLTVTNACGQTDAFTQAITVTPSSGTYNFNCCSENTSIVTYHIPVDVTISGSTFFNNPIVWTPTNNPGGVPIPYVKGTIIIPQGEALVIDGLEIRFGPLGKIIVERGGGLAIINSSILDGLPECSTMWQGIEVWGTSNKPQWEIETNQGLLYILSNSQINHAHNGVFVGKPGQGTVYDPAYGGGLVFSINSNYNNNATSIKFTPYNFIFKFNVFFGIPYPNFSFVEACQFQTTGTVADPGYSISGYYPNVSFPHYSPSNNDGFSPMHALLLNTGRIRFTNNIFSDNAIEGIEAFNSGILAEDNIFENMDFGFIGLTTVPSAFKNHTLNNNAFNDISQQGVTENGQMTVSMRINDFINNSTNQSSYLLGTYLENTSIFQLIDNFYFRPQFGLGIINSGTLGGIVNDNSNDIGNLFRENVIGTYTFFGNPSLQISCNTYDNSVTGTDIYNYSWANLFGQLANQGSCADPAGDKFDPTPNTPGNRLKEIVNFLSPPFIYSHHNNWPLPDGCEDCVVPEAVSGFLLTPATLTDCAVPYVSNSSCHFCEECKTQQYLDDKKIEIGELEQELQDVQSNLDDGNSQILLNAINSNMSYGKLKNLLLAASPLSDTVLKAFISKVNYLPHGIFKDVIVANNPVSDSVWLYYLEPALGNLSGGIAGQIRQSYHFPSSSIRTPGLINRDLQIGINERQAVLNSMLLDSLNILSGNVSFDGYKITFDSVDFVSSLWVYNTLLGEESSEIDRLLCSTYLSLGQLDSAGARLSKLPGSSLDEQELISFYSLLIQLESDSLSVFEINAAQESFVRNLAAKDPTHPGISHARALLWLLGEKSFPMLPFIPSARRATTNKDSLFNEKPTIQEESKKFWLGKNLPDPFKENCMIPYFIDASSKNAVIRLFNVAGSEMKSYHLQPGAGSVLIDSQMLNNGIYYYRLEINNTIVANEKMVLIK